MLLYNETIIIEEKAAQEWLKHMEEIHLPEVKAAGLVKSHRLLKVVDSPNEGLTYCSQYEIEDQDKYNQFLTNHAEQLQKVLLSRFKERYVIYNTLMEVL